MRTGGRGSRRAKRAAVAAASLVSLALVPLRAGAVSGAPDPAPLPLRAARQQTFVLAATATAWTSSAQPTLNSGASPTIVASTTTDDTRTGYLRFDTAPLPRSGRIVGVTLGLTPRTADGGPAGLTVTALAEGSPAWTESEITGENAPQVATGIRVGGYDGTLTAGSRTAVPLDAARGHAWLLRGAVQTVALTSSSSTAADFDSRSAAEPPRLTVVVQPDPVVAFFGSGTCDPTQAVYRNGLGTGAPAYKCKGKYVADALFGDPADPATLEVDVLAAVGDLQPSNGDYVKYCESSTLGVRDTPPACPRGGFLSAEMLGRPSLLPILQATTGNHDYGAGTNGSNKATDTSCGASTTYTTARGYFASIGDPATTGPSRASDAWASDYMRASGFGVPDECTRNREGSGGYHWFQVGQPADGDTPGWSWAVIVLNGNCTPGTAAYHGATNSGCTPTSDQYQWVSRLLDHIHGTENGGTGSPRCVAVMLHQQAWSNNSTWQSGGVVKATYAPLWKLMHDKGVDLVVNGNLHVYERFLPLGNIQGGKPVLESNGVIQVTASTGGETHGKLTQDTNGDGVKDSPFYPPSSSGRLRDTNTGAEVSAAQDATSYGTVDVTFHAGGFDTAFAAVPDGSGASYSDYSTAGTCQNTRIGTPG